MRIVALAHTPHHILGAHAAFLTTIVKHFAHYLPSRLHPWFVACTASLFVIATLGITLQFLCGVQIFYGDVPLHGIEDLFTAYTPKDKLSVAVTVVFVTASTFGTCCDLIGDTDISFSSGFRTPCWSVFLLFAASQPSLRASFTLDLAMQCNVSILARSLGTSRCHPPRHCRRVQPHSNVSISSHRQLCSSRIPRRARSHWS